MKTFSALALIAGLPSVMGHYVFDRLVVNGQVSERWEYVRELGPQTSNGPMSDVTDPEIRCNKGSFANAAKTKTSPVKAGDTVGFIVNSVLGHPGPLFVYMSKSTTANVSTYEGEGEWFKIYEIGVKTYATYNSAMTWASDGWTEFNFTIPTGIEDGQYLLRAEHIAIHGAGALLGSQFYMACAQIEVTGGTGAKPSPVGTFPGIYGQSDPGILFEPYWPPVVNYSMPGLKVYPEGGSYPDFTADPSLPPTTQPLPVTAGGPPPTVPTAPPAVSSSPAAAVSTAVSSVASPVSAAASTLATVIRVPTLPGASTASARPPVASGGACNLK